MPYEGKAAENKYTNVILENMLLILLKTNTKTNTKKYKQTGAAKPKISIKTPNIVYGCVFNDLMSALESISPARSLYSMTSGNS